MGRYSNLAASRGASAGRPAVLAKWAPKVRSIACQSMTAASRTSGCFALICSIKGCRNNFPDYAADRFNPIATAQSR